MSFKAQQARPRILVTSLFGHQNRGDWELTLALFDVLREAFPACAIHGLCRDPEAESGYFPGVSFGALLGVSTRAAGLRRLLESSISFACGFVATAFGILTGLLPNALARSYREADLIVASPGGFLVDHNIGILRHIAHLDAAASVQLLPDMAFYRAGTDQEGAERLLRDIGLADMRSLRSMSQTAKFLFMEARRLVGPAISTASLNSAACWRHRRIRLAAGGDRGRHRR